MKTLYVRIVVTFVLVALASGAIGLLLTSLYYESSLRSDNERKIVRIADVARDLFERDPKQDPDAYLQAIAGFGYQIYAVDEEMRGRAFGSPFKHGALDERTVRSVLGGAEYRGMSKENHRLELLAFFENSVRNTYGFRLTASSGDLALFIRPDLAQQIGEVRKIVAVLLVGTFGVSLLLIFALSRYIVKPIQALTKATGKLAEGRYDVELDVSRKDEIGRLAFRFAEMAKAIGHLEERRQAFVANVSHEFQTPLTSIRGFAHAALEPDTAPEEKERYLAVIAEESGRLSTLAKQLLTLAFLDKDGAEPKRTTFRLDEQIRQIVILLEWQWADKTLRLDLELDELTVTADESLLYEVWLNLLGNAIKFTEAGGTVGVRLRQAGSKTATIEVWDTGAGIPASDLPLIFERFHQADPNRGTSGSGLGLSIARKIAVLHGGDIAVRSEPGRGSSFTVTLPLL